MMMGEKVTDDVVSALLPLAGSLQKLFLINCSSLTSASLDTLKQFNHLIYLNTSGTTAVGEAEADAIKTAIPALQVKGRLNIKKLLIFKENK
ncbi:MAG: hypothetical protein K2W94_05685 [Alphaproteobacteria bacterium]|nr:hypothetical protein [Alphaproteobacteria bacterium]